MSIVLQLNKKGLLKIISLLLLVFFIACAAKISYKGEKNQEGKYHGKGIITFINGEQWVGEFKDGEPYNGVGVYIWPDSSRYEGEIIKGLFQGQGTYLYADGKKYVGEWKDGEYNGQGTLTYADGEQWKGEFKDGEPYNVSGVYIWPDSSWYE